LIEHIENTAKHLCKGVGLDIGAVGEWTIKGGIPVNVEYKNFMGMDAMTLPDYKFDYIFSSHCLEHLDEPLVALQYWMKHIRTGGVLFLYLPHPDMPYWRPENHRLHKHIWFPKEMKTNLKKLGLGPVLSCTGHDLYMSFAVVGIKQ